MLLITPTTYNLGQVKFGTKHTFEYLVTNTYPVSITIDKIVAGCSACTKVEMDNYTISPSDIVPMYITFTPGSLGLQTKSITIIAFTGGSLLPQVKVKFKATVS